MNLWGNMVKSAERVLQILEHMGSKTNGVTHGELTVALEIPKSSLSALLSNLVYREYLSFDKQSKRYHIGPQILTLAGKYLAGLDIIKTARPFVKELMTITEESTEFAVKKGNDIQILCKEDCLRPLQRVIQLGELSPIYITAAGKAILAFLSEKETNEYLSSEKMTSYTKNTITDPEVLRKQLDAVRKDHLAYSFEERIEGITAIAAPIFDMDSRVVGSLVVPTPTFRFTPDKKEQIEDALRDISRRLSHQLGYLAKES